MLVVLNSVWSLLAQLLVLYTAQRLGMRGDYSFERLRHLDEEQRFGFSTNKSEDLVWQPFRSEGDEGCGEL